MRTRLDFREELKTVLGNDFNLYFQPNENTKLVYPCCIYEIVDHDAANADDLHYRNTLRYTVTIIDKNPDSVHWMKLIDLSYSNFDRYYASDNMNHWVFRIYY